jgi:hypothetical protein
MATRQRRVFAHYLPWYTAAGDGWTYIDSSGGRVQQYVSAPLIGEYSQLNASVREYHLLSAVLCGMDGFVINWDPRSALQTQIVSAMFASAEALPAVFYLHAGASPSSPVRPRLLVSYDYQGDDHSASTLQQHFEFLRDAWVASPVYFHDFDDDFATSGGAGGQGGPVVVLWNDAAVAAYSAAARAVFGGNVTLLTRNAVFENANLSSGAFQWPTPQAASSYDASNWGQTYLADFDWRMAHQEDYGHVPPASAQTLQMGVVYPGFNDSNVPPSWNAGQTRFVCGCVVGLGCVVEGALGLCLEGGGPLKFTTRVRTPQCIQARTARSTFYFTRPWHRCRFIDPLGSRSHPDPPRTHAPVSCSFAICGLTTASHRHLPTDLPDPCLLP